VSDFDSADVSPSSARFNEELNKDLGELLGKQFDRKPKAGEREREGLPPSYRMRADAHYVDQLMERSPEMPLRSIAIDEIAVDGTIEGAGLQPLTQSIAAHGLLQPLLVRTEGSAYRLITGRKRLAAAQLARLSRVPCFVHQVTDEQAQALAIADNLRGRDDSSSAPAASSEHAHGGTDVLANLAASVATIQSAARMLTGRGTTMSQKVGLDLLQAETRRVAWQLTAAGILDQRHPWHLRRAVLGPLVIAACEAFAPESRLKGIELMPEISDWNVAASVDEDAFVCAISGAILSLMPLAEAADARTMTVLLRASAEGSPSVDITQGAASLPPAGAGRFFDSKWVERPGGWVAAVGAATAKTVAVHHDGDAIFIGREGRGSTVRLTFGH